MPPGLRCLQAKPHQESPTHAKPSLRETAGAVGSDKRQYVLALSGRMPHSRGEPSRRKEAKRHDAGVCQRSITRCPRTTGNPGLRDAAGIRDSSLWRTWTASAVRRP